MKATVASRSMAMSGLIVLAFIIYHLAHFTVRVTDPRFSLLKADPLNRYDVYSMMVYGFQNIYRLSFLHPRDVSARTPFKPRNIQLLPVARLE